jgi:hypothetical protein
MWSLTRTLLMALALAGFVGQATARAMPMCADGQTSVATAAMDCAHMAGMPDMAKAPAKAPHSSGQPCKGMSPDCMADMCCAVAITPPAAAQVAAPVTYERIRYSNADLTRDGLEPSPRTPPPLRLS